MIRRIKSHKRTNQMTQKEELDTKEVTTDTASNDSLNNLVLDIENALKSLSSNKNTSAQSSDKDNDGDQK
jgi:hypothetical protein